MPGSAMNAFVRRFTQPGVILVAIVLTGAMGLIGGFRQIRSQILGPFAVNNTPQVNSAAQVAADTDGDGLTDEQELQIYGTSPFIADSDSDGIPDGQEVAAGSSPTCATGTSCDALSVTGAAVATPTSTSVLSDTTPVATEATPEQLRQLLIQAGLTNEQVQSLTDEELRAAWQAALQQASGQ